MRNAIAFLKSAILRTPMAGLGSCYIIKDGMIYARAEPLQAGVPFASEQNFNIPANELDAALGRMTGEIQFAYKDRIFVVRSGRLRASIQCMEGEPPPVPELQGAWLPVPPRLIAALKLALPFASQDKNWTSGIRLMENRITAIKNTCGIDIEVPGLQTPPVLISTACAEFLTAADAPAEYQPGSNAFLFRWPDGRWLKMQLLSYAMPAMVDDIFVKAGTDCPAEITQDWRAAFDDVAALSEGFVEITAEGLVAGRQASVMDVAVATTLPSEMRTHWDPKILGPVIAIAAKWNPAAYPGACAFIGEGLRGVVIGVKR